MRAAPTKRILLINPNTSSTTTERLLKVLSAQLPANVTLEGHTARFGASYIACEASHAVAAHAMLEKWAEQVSAPLTAPAGVLIGCFGDPGLFALRESSACPVTGLAEASFIEASSFGSFAIVTGGERWRPMLQRLAQHSVMETNYVISKPWRPVAQSCWPTRRWRGVVSDKLAPMRCRLR